jgi:long-chain acyl-CoA synthetase
MLTHENFMSNVQAACQVLPLGDSDLFLSFLPLAHSFERTAGYYAPLYAGGTIAYAESIEKMPLNLAEVRPTLLASVPRIYEKIYSRILGQVSSGSSAKQAIFQWAVMTGKQVNEYKLRNKPVPLLLAARYSLAHKLVFSKLLERLGGRLRFAVSGGAPLDKEIGEFFSAAGLIILEGYGLTETSPVLAVNRLERIKYGTVGPALPSVEIRIASDGEILAKGPNIMKGYFNKPDATEEVLKDGWFHTGDIGEVDSEGYLKITDRKKDIIVTAGGKNISPQNIENKLKLEPLIEHAAIIGDKRKFISVLLVPAFDALQKWAQDNGVQAADKEGLVNAKEVQEAYQEAVERVNAGLARYEQIKKFRLLPVEFTQETGELTPSMKVKRKVVNDKFSEFIESMY